MKKDQFIVEQAELASLFFAGHLEKIQGQGEKACEIWETAWQHLFSSMDESGQTDVVETVNQTRYDVFIQNLALDYDNALRKLALKEPAYAQKRIDFCEAYLSRRQKKSVPDVLTARGSIADSLFLLGRTAEGEAAFKELLKEHPKWAPGWVLWANEYGVLANEERKDPRKTISILIKGREQMLDEDTEHLDNQLIKTYQECGRQQEVTALLLEKCGNMSLEMAIRNIKKITGKLPYKEIYCIRAYRKEAAPQLLDFVTEYIKGWDGPQKGVGEDPLYAMLLLAEFGEKQALDIFLNVLEMDDMAVDWILGDVLTETYCQMVAAVSGAEGIEKIKKIIENYFLDKFHRSSALNALLTLYVEGLYPREDFFEYLGALLERENDPDMITCAVRVSADVCAESNLKRIKRAFRLEFADESVIGLDDVKTSFKRMESADQALALLQDEGRYCFFRNALSELRQWGSLEQEKKPIQNLLQKKKKQGKKKRK